MAHHLIKCFLSFVICGFSISRTCLLSLLVSAKTCQPRDYRDPIPLSGLSELAYGTCGGRRVLALHLRKAHISHFQGSALPFPAAVCSLEAFLSSVWTFPAEC